MFRGGKFAEIYEEFKDCLLFPHLTHLNSHNNLTAYFPDDASLPPNLGNNTTTTLCSMAKCSNIGLGPKIYFVLTTMQR
jgi:hypothetical protein